MSVDIGDVGRFDASGRLFVEGRDDDMIVSGGENVFPSEVEDLLSDHPDILEAAVVGVPDDDFGQRLRAFVVARVNPLRFMQGEPPALEEVLKTMIGRAAKFNTEKVKQEDIASSGGAPDDMD